MGSNQNSTYESLIAWQKANELALAVYKNTKIFPKDELFGLTSQIRRASLSVPTNIAEGYARKNSKVLKTFLDIAYGSLVETNYLLGFSSDIGYLSPQTYQKLAVLCDDVGALIWKFTESVVRKEQ